MTIEEILALDDSHQRSVAVPEWKTEVLVGSMSADERAGIEKRWLNKKPSDDPSGFRRDVLEKSLKNPDGTPFGTAEQIAALMGKNAGAVERLFEVAFAINGFGKKDVEDLEKN